MERVKRKFSLKKLLIVIAAVVIVFLVIRYVNAQSIERYDWRIDSVSATTPYYMVVAYDVNNKSVDENDNSYKFAQRTDIIFNFDSGTLTITDKINDKVYEGTYRRARDSIYITIDGKEGIATISRGASTLPIMNFAWEGYSFLISAE